ncbi:MAG TPA: hypothetical protein VMG82_03070 [Candidatus Sulfotelmatobacter sp.]|nr:hypothetical protein [Candidatus Sulfotelmatobacter sp.]
MKLNHLNLTVSNVPDAHHFLEKFFGLKGYNGHGAAGNHEFHVR